MPKITLPGSTWRRLVLLLVLVPAACKDIGGPGGDAVATVQISGAPAGPVVSPTTVQLVATPLNSTGAVVSNRKVSWRSSDETVATVSAQGLVSAIGAGPVTITAVAEGKEGTTALDVRAGAPLGPDGGTLDMLGGAVTLSAPRGALSQTTTILLRPAVSPPEGARLAPGTAFELGPEGLRFGRVATLALKYDPAKLPSGTTEASLQLYTLSEGKWALVRGSTVDPTTRAVTGGILRAGTYAVAGTPVDRVSLGGALLSGALYTGQSGELRASLFDANGDTLRGRPVAWKSSDPQKATVDGAGKVTGVALGTVTITATSEEKSASTTVTILSRPVASWDQTSDWATFQGNPRHTGEVAATLDPVVFRELWATTLLARTPLDPVSEGGGAVYVTAGRRLFGLDLRTGAEKWSYDFGSVESVDPPAYANGRVFLTTGGHGNSFLWALDAGTGAVRFRSSYRNQWSSYYAPTVVGQTVYMAGGYYGGMYAFSATDGTQLWFAQTNQYDQWTPAVSDGRVYAYTGENSPQLSVVDAATGTALYKIDDPNFAWNGWSMHIAPVLGSRNNVLATQNGRLLSFDLQNRGIGWEQKASYTGNVTVSDGVIYVFNNQQVEARRESDGSLLWVWIPPEGRPRGTMVATRNLLFVSTEANTYAVDLAARRQTWTYPAGGHLALSREGILLIAQSSGRIAAISVR